MSSYTLVITDDGDGNFDAVAKRAPSTAAAGGVNLQIPQIQNFNAGVTAITPTDASNATPIVLTVPSGHGLAVGDVVTNYSINGNTAANGTFRISVVTATTATLANSVGNGAFTTSASARVVKLTKTKTFGTAVQAALAAALNDRAAGN